LYCSTEARHVVGRALSVLGLGRSSLREIALDGEGTIAVDALQRMLHDDTHAGARRWARQPALAISMAGRHGPEQRSRSRDLARSEPLDAPVVRVGAPRHVALGDHVIHDLQRPGRPHAELHRQFVQVAGRLCQQPEDVAERSSDVVER
jgi:hypothetical protein